MNQQFSATLKSAPQFKVSLKRNLFDAALAAGTPIPGPEGPQGVPGPQGPAGADGTDGAPGVAGPAGADGSQGPAGPQGPAGDAGVQGAPGATGSQGPKGDQGIQGQAGPAGSQGVAGATGPQGLPLAVQDEGAPLPQRSYLDFAGAGVTATDDSANNRTVVTVPAPPVSSIFTRTGDVVAATGDYSVAQITGAMADPLTTKGDLIARSTVTTRLPIGSNTQVLTVDTTAATAVKWAAPTPLTTKGDLCVFAAAVVRHPVGANGQVLVADSAQANGVRWGGGGLVLLEEHTASASASLTFTTSISSVFDEYMIEFINVRPVTDEDNLWMRMSTNGGSSYDAGANYGWAHINWRSTTSLAAGLESAATKMQITDAGVDSGAATSSGVLGSIRLTNPASPTMWKYCVGKLYAFGASGFHIGTEHIGSYQVVTPVNAFQFLYAAGNIASGTIRVYGFTKT